MDVSTSQQFIDVYNRISKLETDITNVVKEFYSNLVKSYDEIVDTPENLSDFNNDLDFITKDEVENRINSISIDDSNYLKKTGEEKQKCTAPTEFEELYTTTQDSEDSSDKVATTKFVHNLVSNNGESVTQQIIGAVGKKYITSKAAESIIKDKIGEHQYGTVVNLVNKKIEDAIKGIEDMIPEVDVPTRTSDLVNDSGFITLGDVPGDLVTSVNGQTGNVQITIPQVPTNVSSFTNDAGYITDPGVTSVNNRTGNVMVQENVQSDWSATTGLAKILNKPSLHTVATSGDYEDLSNTPDLSAYAQYSSLAAVATSGNYNDLSNKPDLTTYLPKSGGDMNANATVKFNSYNARYLTISGNKIIQDLTNTGGGYAGSFYTVKTKGADDNIYETVGIGFSGNSSSPKGLKYLYAASPGKNNSNPDIKFNVDGTTEFLSDVTGVKFIKKNGTSSQFLKADGSVDDTQYATLSDIQLEVSALVDQAPTTLDTLNELASALGNDPNFATTVASQIGAKYTKPSGGIPKSDLSSAVQTSLSKADTALQSHQDISGKVDKVTSTDNAVVRFNGTSGAIQNSGVTIDDSNNLTAAKFVTKNGTSSQFVKGDGSVDSTVYATKTSDDNKVPYGGVLMPTNSFGGKKVYINSMDNAFNAADQKYYVTITKHSKSANGITYPYVDSTKEATDDDYYVDGPIISTLTTQAHKLFDGSYETYIRCGADEYIKIRIMFGSNTSPSATTSYFSGYPYGNFYISYYSNRTPNIASLCRIYNKYSTQGVGWKLLTATAFTGTLNASSFIERVHDESNYSRTCVEFIIFGNDVSGRDVMITQIDYQLIRPNIGRDGSTVTKFDEQSLYFPFNWYSDHAKTVTINNNGNVTAVKFIKTNGTSSQFLKADGSVDSNTYLTQTTFESGNPDLKAIEELTDTSGFLKKTSANTWTLDTNTYLTEHQSLENYATKNYVEALEQRIAALEAALNNS